jgi:hypothetical protein
VFRSSLERRITLTVAGALALAWFGIYALTVSPTVSFVDSGELSTTLSEPGIVHPPGYPLYTLMGYVVTRFPWAEPAWWVNMLSVFWGGLAIGFFCMVITAFGRYYQWQRAERTSLLKERRASAKRGQKREAIPRSELQSEAGWRPNLPFWAVIIGGAAGSSLLAVSTTYWSRATQAKMYSLHYALIAIFLFAAVNVRWSIEREDQQLTRRWLILLSIAFGLGLTNHLTILLIVPGALCLVLLGADSMRRAKDLLRYWAWIFPALAAPLLLYLYLPLRSSQEPLMNWGSPDNPGAFWRHISGWQYRVNFGLSFEDVPRVTEYLAQQWIIASWGIAALAAVALVLLWRKSVPPAIATLLIVVTVVLFSVAYEVSETDAYMVPVYLVFSLWIGLLPPLLLDTAIGYDTPKGNVVTFFSNRPQTLVIVSGVLLLSLIEVLLLAQYGRQDRSGDRLAEQFARNVFSELPEQSILLTDYWDFYSPTIYMQNVRRERPDLRIVDITLVRYPWYADYLEKYSPELADASSDLMSSFGAEQAKWVAGEPYNGTILSERFFDLLQSFASRQIASRPVFVLWQPCPDGACESRQLMDSLGRQFGIQQWGLTTRLYQESPGAGAVPPEPDFRLKGLLDRYVPLDVFSRLNSQFYLTAYRSLAEIYRAAGKEDAANRMNRRYFELENALQGR